MPKELKVTIPKVGKYLIDATEGWGKADQPIEANALEWANYGIVLGRAERLMPWEIGDWYNRGEQIADRAMIISHPDWTGPSYQTCRNYGFVAKAFPVYRRRYNVSFSVHQELAHIGASEADQRLLEASQKVEETGKGPTQRDVRQQVKRERRAEREESLAHATAQASEELDKDLYGVILADPPWKFDPYSRDSGMDRSAENHYGCMDVEAICALAVPAADDAVLFLWRTAPMLEAALQVMQAWGFTYKSEWIWGKDRVGTGYWGRNQHEVLMIGTKGHPVAPAQGQQPNSLIIAPVGQHSEKPAVFQEIIEDLYPTTAKIEMFARKWRHGWRAFGNQLPPHMQAAE